MNDLDPAPRHRALQELYAYWQAKRGAAFAPPRAALQPQDIPALLPIVVLVDLVGTPPRFRVRLAGTKVVEAYGAEITGRYIDELDFDELEAAVLASITEVVASGRPSVVEREYTRHDGRHVKYERLLLPLSSDGATVDKLLAGFVVEQAFGPPGGSLNPATSP